MNDAIDPTEDARGPDGEEAPSRASVPDPPKDPESTRHRRGVLGSIIRTTKATSTHVTATDAAMAARKCRNCGGARPAGSDLRVCEFCGDRFMTEEAGSGVDPAGPAPEG